MKPAQITRALVAFNGAVGLLMFFGMVSDVGAGKAFTALIGSLVIGTICGAAYLVPTYISADRGHSNATAILVLNLLLGWTMLGWIAALVWALTRPGPPQQVTTETRQPDQPSASTVEQLEKLAGLRERGALTEEEFAEQKRRLLVG